MEDEDSGRDLVRELNRVLQSFEGAPREIDGHENVVDSARSARSAAASDDKNRTGRMLHDAFGRASEKGVLETGAAMRRHHDHVSFDRARDATDLIIYRHVGAQVTMRRRDPVFGGQLSQLSFSARFGVFLECCHRHRNRRTRRHEANWIVVFVDMDEVNRRTETSR